jgi:hypothetical protein
VTGWRRLSSFGVSAAATVGLLLGAAWLGTAAAAEPQRYGFRRLSAAEIRARVVGREITDDFHWGEYYRRDGVLVLTDMGRRRTGQWRIERDLLCRRRDPAATGFECFQVWVSGDEVSLRQSEADRPFPVFLRRHEGGAGG